MWIAPLCRDHIAEVEKIFLDYKPKCGPDKAPF